ncbi:beta-glucosidase [Halanaerobium saccharolyticum]|uniref:Beta-glucosidase n=1 Tax=Halanaerobium saccharolyticum TaxID=43595 RepID=A0A4R7YKF9_9FIRM|nr:glycoside hydrolase family 3 protein [Halanaerobium saccharolyticum]RAK04165.1 beta-glucosidase [Halanaerobium saccharolyticum]TDV97960.1 beta-glucosidase [Halanaerobium saccharolyticum]TDX51021.1 beta-glucosidase [Halanaerobium saccharolyticum]
MKKIKLDMKKYAAISRQAAAEGCVLLRNEEQALPIKRGEKISVFGRIQFDYYKSGTGSGGLVNTEYVVGILDALKANNELALNQDLIDIYEEWVKDNPFNHGEGWAQEPWCQKEMPVSAELAKKSAAESDLAVIILGRTAGEDRDNSATKGSYLLTDTEEEMLARVTKAFDRVAVVLNVGNIIDMKWVEKYQPQAVLYAWHGGMEGGNGTVDVLSGKVNPSGKLSDTIAYDIEDYPSMDDFGNQDTLLYKEDIYVGYRYFETAAKDRVVYPFGYGLSYTEFEMEILSFDEDKDLLRVEVEVRNTGDKAGKEVVQVYASKPLGKLGKAARTLEAFTKTKLLEPGERQKLILSFPKNQLASYDDSGITGHKSSYVLEAGEYKIYAGSEVRNTELAGSFSIDTLELIEELEEACAPVESFERLKVEADGTMAKEEVPRRTVDLEARIAANRPQEISYTGDQGIKLKDVYQNQAFLEDFIAQLSDHDLACLIRGEGMSSPRVTPGTAAAFGGVSKSLVDFGIPAACAADGPSGIRMDCGTTAFSLPNGTSLACTFNTELVGELFDLMGQELLANRIETLLGPGMNIHRTPLNGRNFEYFSEDPLLTGKMAAVQLRAMNKYKVTGTVKHYVANNQEAHRHDVNAVVSERALREIYLKGFEIAVKEGEASSIMSTYGGLNGFWTAGNYDLLTTILREEWDFDGIVMTDWWAKINEEGKKARKGNTMPMVRAQNDLYMVNENPEKNSADDNTLEGLKEGKITRGELQRNAANILKFIMDSAVMERYLSGPGEELEAVESSEDPGNVMEYYDLTEVEAIDLSDVNTTKGESVVFGIIRDQKGVYKLSLEMKASGGEHAQVPVSLFLNNKLNSTITLNGTGEWQTVEKEIVLWNKNNYIKLYFAQSGMKLGKMTVEFEKKIESD